MGERPWSDLAKARQGRLLGRVPHTSEEVQVDTRVDTYAHLRLHIRGLVDAWSGCGANEVVQVLCDFLKLFMVLRSFFLFFFLPNSSENT